MLAKSYSYIDRFGQYNAPDTLKEAVPDYYTFTPSAPRRRSYARGGVATFMTSLGNLLTSG
jgi:hypothetical protein